MGHYSLCDRNLKNLAFLLFSVLFLCVGATWSTALRRPFSIGYLQLTVR
jgi:hypothetical protein